MHGQVVVQPVLHGLLEGPVRAGQNLHGPLQIARFESRIRLANTGIEPTRRIEKLIQHLGESRGRAGVIPFLEQTLGHPVAILVGQLARVDQTLAQQR